MCRQDMTQFMHEHVRQGKARNAAHKTGRNLDHKLPAPTASGPGPARLLGDIVIATGRASRQARAAGLTEQQEWRRLALHGLLHLLGYDHERDDGRMQRLERRLQRRGGLPVGQGP